MPVSNKDVEVLSEALFCYYFAIYKNKKEKEYRASLWNQIKTSSDLSSFTNRFGITSMVKLVNNAPAFISVFDPIIAPFSKTTLGPIFTPFPKITELWIIALG